MNLQKYIILGLAVTTVLGGCKKELDLKPTDVIASTNAFVTINDVQQATNGVYGYYGSYLNDMYVNALLSDEAKIGADNNGQGLFPFRYQYNSDATTGGEVIAAWGGYYQLIDLANRALAAVDAVTVANPTEAARRPILKAQLLGMRALAHFELLESYAKKYDPADPLGVPIMLKSDPLGKPARARVADVLAQIQTDFSAASTALPAVTPASFTDTVINQINIAAFQARIAAYMGDWTNALKYANTVINSGVKGLASGTDYTGIWTDVNSNETLFRIRYATGNAVGSIWTSGNLVYIAPSDKLTAAYDAADIRKATFIGVGTGTAGNGIGTGKVFVNKFFASSRGGRVVDNKAARISEMYLIRAEAYAQQNDLTNGAADLNALRARRITGYTNQTFTDKGALLDAIATERFKELCFEGFRFFDIKRTGGSVQRNASDVTSANWQSMPANSMMFALPIPQTELLANKNMVQNPGY